MKHTFTLRTRERDLIIANLKAEVERLDKEVSTTTDKYTKSEAFESAIELNDIITLLETP